MNIVLFGPPGAGKGTQSNKLEKDFNLFKISTGDLLREEIKKNSKLDVEIKSLLDQGSLVSDNIINNLIENILSNKTYFNRLIFDGYPRNLNQAEYLDKTIKKYNQKITCVFCLKVDENTIIKRIIGRILCSKCGLTFNEFFNPPGKANHLCDIKFLEKRSDDNEKTARDRFTIYNKETLPLCDYYQSQNLLHEIDGANDIPLIYQEIRKIMHSLET